jgi:hypothetical protein
MAFEIRRGGTCSVCGGPAEALTEEWWHTEATECNGRETGEYVPLATQEHHSGN